MGHWGEAESSQLPPQLAYTFLVPPIPSAQGLGDPRASAHHCWPSSALAHAPTGSAGRGAVRARLFSQPVGRAWRQGREVCRWQMPRYLCPQRTRRQLLGGRELPRHRKLARGSLEQPPSACQVEGRQVLPVTKLHLRLPHVMWGNGRA